MAEIKEKLGEFKAGKRDSSPCPLATCPWCGTKLGASSLTLDDPRKPAAVIVGCANPTCDFCPARHDDGLPVVFVDEQIYRELPAFLVGTVDKFAMLPFRAEAGLLFGGAIAVRGREAIAPGDSVPRGAVKLPDGLRPPELIVQDELHLITGPLGTMVGLYETAVEARAAPPCAAPPSRCARSWDAATCGPSRPRDRTRATPSSRRSTSSPTAGCTSGSRRPAARSVARWRASTRRCSWRRARTKARTPTRT
jgi:hypothetical protein